MGDQGCLPFFGDTHDLHPLPVLDTRRRTNKIVHVRQCRHCQRRVITHEAIGAWRAPGGDDCPE